MLATSVPAGNTGLRAATTRPRRMAGVQADWAGRFAVAGLGVTAQGRHLGIPARDLRRQAATVGKATAEKGRAVLAKWLEGALKP